MIALVGAWGTAFTLLRWIPCYPVRAFWDLSIEKPHCWGFGSRNPVAYMHVFVAQAVSTAALDFLVFVIPLPLCFRRGHAVEDEAVFDWVDGVGVVVGSPYPPPVPVDVITPRLTNHRMLILHPRSILCATLRMIYVLQHFTRPHRFDPTWNNATTAGLACLEVDLAAVCAALPVFWPVFTTTWGRIFVTTEVSVTREVGQLHPHHATVAHMQQMECGGGGDKALQHGEGRGGAEGDDLAAEVDAGGWMEQVWWSRGRWRGGSRLWGRDDGVGENETVVEAEGGGEGKGRG